MRGEPGIGLSTALADAGPQPPFDIFRSLKEGTADIHLRLEERVPVFREGFDLAGYGRLLECYFGFWSPLEAKLSQSTSLKPVELDLQGRLKSPLLAADLLFLGLNPAAVRHCDRLPAVDTFARGAGCLYVLEGSTLGSRFISRRIEQDLQLRDGTGASFFNAYGESVGRRWKDFKSFVAAHVNSGQTDEIVTAARQTFECFYDWLGASS